MTRACHRPARALVLVVWAALSSSALAADVQYLVSARSEVRTRNVQPGSTGILTNELELRPIAGLLIGSDDTRLAVSYQPNILFRDPFQLGPVGLLHRGLLVFTERWARATLSVTADGTWGITDISALRPPDSAPPGSIEVPTLGLVPYVRLYGRASLDTTVARRVTLGFDAGYQLSGSVDARPTLPIQQGPFATVRLGWTPNARDTLTTSAQGAHAEFSTGQRQTVVQGFETWRHVFTARTALDVSAGVAFTREEVPVIDVPQPPIPGLYREVLPVASATFSHRLVGGGTVDLRGSARLGPFSDRYTGNVYERLEAFAQAQWNPTRTLQATGTVGGGWAVDIGRAVQAGDRIVYGDAQVGWTAFEWLLVQGSARLAYAEQPRYDLRGWQWLLGVAVTVRDQGAL